ncbi:MAG TPA: hypothetical protein VF341_08045, partial [Anaeromyxobacteraceae bacterium]
MGKHEKRRKEQRRKRREGAAGELVERADRFQVFAPGTLRLDEVDLTLTVERRAYEKRLLALQREVYQLQVDNYLAGGRAIFAFEGWDAAGKGGCIKRLTALMDPRGLKVWPIAAPRDAEKRNHWLWRFWYRL